MWNVGVIERLRRRFQRPFLETIRRHSGTCLSADMEKGDGHFLLESVSEKFVVTAFMRP